MTFLISRSNISLVICLDLSFLLDNLAVEGNVPEQEILSVLDVPPGKMGCIIGKKGASILSIKESCG